MPEIPNMEAPPQIQAHGELSVYGSLPRNEGLSQASQTASEYVINLGSYYRMLADQLVLNH